MNKILPVLLLIFTSLIVTSCDFQNSTPSNTSNELLEKYEKVIIGMSKEEVGDILTISNEANNSYEDGKISISYYGTNNTVSSISVELSYNNEEILDPKTDLKKAKDFTDRLNNGQPVTYNDLVSSFKTEGYCTRKSTEGCRRYAWSDKNGRYINATISSEDRIMSIFGKA